MTNNNTCYFRYVKTEDKIDLSFLLNLKSSVRQFNFCRKPTESLESVRTRILANVQRTYNKMNKKKKCNDEVQISVMFQDDKKNPLPDTITCLDLFSWQGTVFLIIQDNVLQAAFNAPWVLSVSLPHSMLVGFPIYPENFITQFTVKEKCAYNWYRGSPLNEKKNIISENHINWELVGDNAIYIPTVQDIGMKIKLECIPGNHETSGPPVETVSKNVVEAGPGKCPFETRHLFTSSVLNDKSFRCVTYNILADLYCDSDFTRAVLHPYCPHYALHIDYRKQLIVKELIGYNADIICLQEVDRKIFDNYLNSILGSVGFDGLFYKKGKEVAEGLAVFYNRHRFSVLGQEHIVMSQELKINECLRPIWNAVKMNDALLERLLDRSTVASATFFQSKDNPGEILIVGNTHLYFHPDADHIRLVQGGIYIYWLKFIKSKLIKENPDKRVSLILCGDFNSVPSNGIYQLYTTGIAPSDLPDWRSNENEAIEHLTLEQDIALSSACGTPLYTNFTAGFADCLDYIFYETSNLGVDQVVPLPSVEELNAHTALPSIVFPSDHIALISDLRFL